MPQDLVEHLLLQLEAAICVLHDEAKLLHLDIKPANILWCGELRELRLCDFGMSEPAPRLPCPQSTVHGPSKSSAPQGERATVAAPIPTTEPRFTEYVTPFGAVEFGVWTSGFAGSIDQGSGFVEFWLRGL